ncbi:MAG: hypothetical protein AMXMBFR13_25560 [Phycisphaerae bacterium]
MKTEAAQEPELTADAPRRGLPFLAWAAVFAGAFLLYGLTANRGAQWQDSGDIMLRILQRELINPLGLALSHALHFWLGRLAAGQGEANPALAITLISSLGAALAVANVFGCVTALTHRWGPALFAAGSLAVANTFWRMATITEVYTLSAALLAAECWALILFTRHPTRRYLWAMLLFNGLGVANHLQAVLTAPILAVVVAEAVIRRRVEWREVAVGCGLWLAGTLPYTVLVIAELLRTGDLVGTVQSATMGHTFSSNVLNTHISPRLLAISAAFVLYNFPNLLLPAAAYGVARARRVDIPRGTFWALAAALAIHGLFVLRYNVVDQHTFFLPVYVLLAIFGGIGAAAVWSWPPPTRRRWAGAGIGLLALTPVLYAVLPAAARYAQVLERFIHDKHEKPYRDDYEYLFVPWAVVDDSAERMSRSALELAQENGMVLVEDSMARFAVQYARRRAGRPDVEIRQVPSSKRPEAQAALAREVLAGWPSGRPIVLVPLNRDRPEFHVRPWPWRRVGDLYILARVPSTEPAN